MTLSLGLEALSAWTRWGLVAALALAGGVVAWFALRQRAGAMGGALSRPKAAWLLWAVLVWFLVCPLLAWEPALSRPYDRALGLFSLSMWLRGVIELYMLYGPKNWRPPYGIGHELAWLALLAAAVVVDGSPLKPTTPWGVVGAVSVGVITLSMILETAYAAVFYKVVQGKTTGEEGIWFADQEDPRWRRINQVTLAWNIPLYMWLLLMVLAAWGAFA